MGLLAGFLVNEGRFTTTIDVIRSNWPDNLYAGTVNRTRVHDNHTHPSCERIFRRAMVAPVNRDQRRIDRISRDVSPVCVHLRVGLCVRMFELNGSQ